MRICVFHSIFSFICLQVPAHDLIVTVEKESEMSCLSNTGLVQALTNL